MTLDDKRELGKTGMQISTIALGCWPIAGVTSLDVNDQDSLATISSYIEAGGNFFDTAYIYGHEGESEKLLSEFFSGPDRDDFVIATKCGLHWNDQKVMTKDASAERIISECEESLKRLKVDTIDLYYLHAPDPSIEIEVSAEAIRSLLDSGKIKSAGISNASIEEMERFGAICPLSACQLPYNLIMREIESAIVPYCVERSISICVYWPLMKGLFAGKLKQDHQFDPKDGRAKYPMFQGEEYQKNIALVEELSEIAHSLNKTVSQLILNWTVQQPGITSALVGAKRSWQIEENTQAMGWSLSDEDIARIDVALENRGTPVTKSAV
jgi:aryl-alcohol dehydrogenase-like predicted oxidoreductase